MRREIAVMAVITLLAAAPAIEATAAGVITFPADADSTTTSKAPKTNRGTAQVLRTLSDLKRIYVRFNVAGLPAGETVKRATLKLRAASASTCAQGVEVFRATNDTWGETTITAGNEPGTTGTRLSALSTWASGSTINLDVTPAVKGAGRVSFVIRMPKGCTASGDSVFSSREGQAAPLLAIETAALAPTPINFVTTCGKSFCIHGEPWRMHGASVYGGLDTPSTMVNLAKEARLNTLRIVNFINEDGSPETAPFEESRWAKVDRMIAAASAADIRVILDLSTYRNLLTKAGRNPYTTDWSPLVSFVTGRRNTVTGVRYADDPTIFLISLAGEVEPPNGSNPNGVTQQHVTDFFNRTLKQWEAADPKHLISSGGLMQLDWNSGVDWRTIFAMPSNDACSIHIYDYEVSSIPAVASHCAQLGKPWITEEFGWSNDIGDSQRAKNFQTRYDQNRVNGSAGAAFWNLGPPGSIQSYDVNSSRPLTHAVVQQAAP